MQSHGLGNQFCRIGLLRIQASYHYYAEVLRDNTDRLTMDFTVNLNGVLLFGP